MCMAQNKLHIWKKWNFATALSESKFETKVNWETHRTQMRSDCSCLSLIPRRGSWIHQLVNSGLEKCDILKISRRVFAIVPSQITLEAISYWVYALVFFVQFSDHVSLLTFFRISLLTLFPLHLDNDKVLKRCLPPKNWIWLGWCERRKLFPSCSWYVDGEEGDSGRVRTHYQPTSGNASSRLRLGNPASEAGLRHTSALLKQPSGPPSDKETKVH